MSRISTKSWERIYDKTVETKSAETLWPVYETYQLRGAQGSRYILAPEYSADSVVRITTSINPLTPKYAGLFLEFARWFDEQKLETAVKVGYGTTLDTTRNVEAALTWAHRYGVLGLGRAPHESFAVVGGVSNSADITAERLGRLDLVHPGTRAYSKGRRGGKHETVEGFVFEAYEANIVLKLYEAATAPTVEASSIARFMSKGGNSPYQPPAKKYKAIVKSDRERYSKDAELARFWALSVVEDAVNRKVENDIYPILLGEPGSYKEGWGFKSLLGAMWFQMRNYMLGEDNKCAWCNSVFHKSRRDKTYCSDRCSGRARAARAYRRKKQREERLREATRSRLQG
jgi:hypothetical protein